MPTQQNNDKEILYRLDAIEDRLASNESYETVQAQRSKASRTIFFNSSFNSNFWLYGLQVIPETDSLETLIIAVFAAIGLWVIADILGMKEFNKLVNKALDSYGRRSDK